jgi:glucose/arabinose dehydrogenase
MICDPVHMIRCTLRRVAPAVLTSLALALVSGVVALPPAEAATTLKPGFVRKQIATGIANPIDMAFTPDGRLFVAQQTGRVRIVRDDGTLGTFLDLRSKVARGAGRGLLGIAFDPDFATNHFVYLDYTRKGTRALPVHSMVVRVTARGNKAVPGSEKLLLRLDRQRTANHTGGALKFGSDGRLYVTTGDNEHPELPQRLTSTMGKVLRINKNGTIPTSNPFYDRTTGRLRAIWARGLRNPFKMDVSPTTGKLLINDVGEDTWEEINRGRAGANYGWPVHEGVTSSPSYTSPLFTYAHGSSLTTGCAITGGAFYDPARAQFPAGYVGDYLYSDFCTGWIRRYDLATDTSRAFAKGFSSAVVDLEVNNEGALFVLLRGATGKVLRIRHP